MKVSIITVVRNGGATIADTLQSVADQQYCDIEHIVIDGCSSDNTLDLVAQYGGRVAVTVSEPDAGIYDAMNKGVARATGDVIGFLNADDVYATSETLSNAMRIMAVDSMDACYGDLVFVRNDLQTVVRYYRSRGFTPEKLAYGWMPAHPALLLKKRLFDRYGQFRTDYRIAADYELITRIFSQPGIRYEYLPEVFVKMRTGGASNRSLRSRYILNKEIVRACRQNGIDTNLFKLMLKIPQKLTELFLRP